MSSKECTSSEKSNNINNNNESAFKGELSSFELRMSSSNILHEKNYRIKFSKENIKEVYEDNFIEEIKKISSLLEDYNLIGMDTEFPGTVYYPLNFKKQNFYYEWLKLNINSLKLIQLGITLRNRKGESPSKFPYYTWQFNFKFDLEKDINSAKSIKLLKKAGINFAKLLKNGIEHKEFASYLITSGLVLNPDIHWICFQGSYDFGYLLRLLINEPLPEKENKFIELLNIYFPNYYDIRMLAKDKCCLQGSLNKLAKRIKIDRGTGISHQAGSDSYITIEIFYRLIKCGIVTKDLMKKNKNILYGIGLGQDNDMIIKYMKNEKNEYQSKEENYYSDDNNNNFEFENNNNMINNCFFYSNIKAFNYSLINMNCYSINYFDSNIFYYNDIKNLPKIIINQKLSTV